MVVQMFSGVTISKGTVRCSVAPVASVPTTSMTAGIGASFSFRSREATEENHLRSRILFLGADIGRNQHS
jgi:hypothetical protein